MPNQVALEEGEKRRLVTFGEDNADCFLKYVGTVIATTQKLPALIAGVMNNEELTYALSEIVGTHLRASLIEDIWFFQK
jgi:hypothetical protein